MSELLDRDAQPRCAECGEAIAETEMAGTVSSVFSDDLLHEGCYVDPNAGDGEREDVCER